MHTNNMEIYTPESVLSLMSTLIPALSRPPFSQSTLDKVPILKLSGLSDGFMQLGSLCTGLVKVGAHLERNNPYELNRLQARCHNSCLFSKFDVACILAKKMHMFEPVNLQVLLTNLCQDSSLDIVLRLQLLEVNFSNLGVLS